jgi:hypothetical protein
MIYDNRNEKIRGFFIQSSEIRKQPSPTNGSCSKINLESNHDEKNYKQEKPMDKINGENIQFNEAMC